LLVYHSKTKLSSDVYIIMANTTAFFSKPFVGEAQQSTGY